MNRSTLQDQLKAWDKQGRYVFLLHDLKKLFPEDSPKTFKEAMNRHVRDGFIERACRAIYVNGEAVSSDRFTLERIAQALRSGHYNYISLESALSEYGVISQIPVDRLTIMTTGKSGVYQTTYGVIEFTHTKRSVSSVLESTVRVDERPLRLATKQAAWRDLKRVGRNTHLVDLKELEDE